MIREKIIERVERCLSESEDTLNGLSKVPTKDLGSFLLYLTEERAKQKDIESLLLQTEQSRFVGPSKTPQKALIQFDSQAYSLLPDDFDSIELSPLGPFGLNHVLAGTDQKNIATTVRFAEVVADPTTALALECAKQRKILIDRGLSQAEAVKMATSQRSIRLQSFDDIPGFCSHFKIFALVSGGEDTGTSDFVQEEVFSHILFYLKLFESLSNNGYWFKDIVVSVSDIRITNALIQQLSLDRDAIGRETQNAKFDCFSEGVADLPSWVLSLDDIEEDVLKERKICFFVQTLKLYEKNVTSVLRCRFPNVTFQFDLKRIAGIGYYQDICFKIGAKNRDGDYFPLVDGGTTDWTARILRSKKEKMLTSGVGTEIVCQHFC